MNYPSPLLVSNVLLPLFAYYSKEDFDLIVEVVFQGNPLLIKIPLACCKCGALSPPTYLDKVEASDTSSSKFIVWNFRFPYCQMCEIELKKKLLFKGSAKGVTVHKNWVRTKKIGGFLKNKKIKYIPFKFADERYGRLFREANKEILLEKALSALK